MYSEKLPAVFPERRIKDNFYFISSLGLPLFFTFSGIISGFPLELRVEAKILEKMVAIPLGIINLLLNSYSIYTIHGWWQGGEGRCSHPYFTNSDFIYLSYGIKQFSNLRINLD